MMHSSLARSHHINSRTTTSQQTKAQEVAGWSLDSSCGSNQPIKHRRLQQYVAALKSIIECGATQANGRRKDDFAAFQSQQRVLPSSFSSRQATDNNSFNKQISRTAPLFYPSVLPSKTFLPPRSTLWCTVVVIKGTSRHVSQHQQYNKQTTKSKQNRQQHNMSSSAEPVAYATRLAETYATIPPPVTTTHTTTQTTSDGTTIVVINQLPPPVVQLPPSNGVGGGCCGCGGGGTPLCWSISGSVLAVLAALFIIIPYIKLNNCVDEVFDTSFGYEYDDQSDTVLCDELHSPGLTIVIGCIMGIVSCIFGCCACCAVGNGNSGNDGNNGNNGISNNNGIEMATTATTATMNNKYSQTFPTARH